MIRQRRIGDLRLYEAEGPTGGACVICLHGSEGGWAGWNDRNAALFAGAGFAAAPVAYSGGDHARAPAIDGVALEVVEAAMRAMRLAFPDRAVALFGASRGAEAALLYAQLSAAEKSERTPDAVMAHAPPDAAWPAFRPADWGPDGTWSGDRRRPAWTWRGEAGRTRPETPLTLESYDGEVLLSWGERDDVWPPSMARTLSARLRAAGKKLRVHREPEEGHIFRVEAEERAWAIRFDLLRTLSRRDVAQLAPTTHAAAQDRPIVRPDV